MIFEFSVSALLSLSLGYHYSYETHTASMPLRELFRRETVTRRGHHDIVALH